MTSRPGAGGAVGEQVVDHHHFLAELEIAFDEVLKAVVLGGGADVCVREAQLVGHHGGICDGARSHAGHGIGLAEVLHYEASELNLDEGA